MAMLLVLVLCAGLAAAFTVSAIIQVVDSEKKEPG